MRPTKVMSTERILPKAKIRQCCNNKMHLVIKCDSLSKANQWRSFLGVINKLRTVEGDDE